MEAEISATALPARPARAQTARNNAKPGQPSKNTRPSQNIARGAQPAQNSARGSQPAQNSTRAAQPAQNNARAAQPAQNNARGSQPAQNIVWGSQPAQNNARAAQSAQNSAGTTQPAQNNAGVAQSAHNTAKVSQPAQNNATVAQSAQNKATGTQSAQNKAMGAQSAQNNASDGQPDPGLASPLRKNKQGDSDADSNKQVHVTGFPPYTQSVDLARTFSKFGNVRVEKLNPRNLFAVLTYTTPEEAKAALEASKKVNIYGELLVVKPYTRKDRPMRDNKQNAPKREFPRTKQKGMIVEPTEIDLSGDFHQQIDQILCSVRLTQEQATAVSTLYADLERVLQVLWPGCVAMPFGSITTGLGIKTSDADCFMMVPQMFQPLQHTFVNKAKRILHNYPQLFAEILSIPRANTPIVKFFHLPTQINCDLSFKTPLGTQNSKLIAFLLHSDPRLIPMAVIIKYWAKVHGLSGTGRLTNYALTMMIIFYLQQPPLMILPSIEWLQRDPKYEFIVDYWNTGFMSNRELLPPSSNTSSIAELLGGFFEYYSTFNFAEFVVCPYLGVPIKKELFLDASQIPKEFNRYKTNVLTKLTSTIRATTAMCVQDPFEQCHNVASAISGKLASEIKAFFKFAANAYEKEKLKECKNFLKTILLEKPKIARSKSHPEYRVNIFPKAISNILRPDWKSVIREAVFDMFETMLKVNLGKVDETVNPDAKREKERFSGVITKAIWKRKQFNRLYEMMNLNFIQKQTRITEEILAVEKETFTCEFHVTLTYILDIKSAVVSIRLTKGDIEFFKEFGKFYIGIMHSWFTILLKPHLKPAPEKPAKETETTKTIDSKNDELDSDDDDNDTEGNNGADDTVENDASSSSDEDVSATGVANDSGQNVTSGEASSADNYEENDKSNEDKNSSNPVTTDT